MSTKHILCFDLGLQAIKAGLYDLNGECLFYSRKLIETISAGDFREQDPLSWEDFLEKTLRRIQKEDSYFVSAIGVTGTSNGCIPINEQGQVIYNALIHLDNRAKKQASDIIKSKSYSESSKKLNIRISAGSLLAKILWLKQNKPDIYDKTQTFLDPTAFLFWSLTGKKTFDYYNAQRCFYDFERKEFHQEIYSEIGVDLKKIPSLVNESVVYTTFLSDKFGDSEDYSKTLVSVGSFDNQSALYGANANFEGTIHENSGSGISLKTISKNYVNCDKLGIISVTFPGTSLYVISSYIRSTGIWLEHWLNKKNITYEAFEKKIKRAIDAKKNSNFYLVPSISTGEIVIYDSEKQLFTSDLPLSDENCKSVLEGFLFETRLILQEIENTVGTLKYVVSGGFSKNRFINVIKASVLNKEIIVCKDPEASLRGTAILAAYGAGLFKEITQAANKMGCNNTTIRPSSTYKEFFRQQYEEYLEIRNIILSLKYNGA